MKEVFQFLIGLLATVIQVVVWPVNELIVATLPDFSSKIMEVTNVFSTVFDSLIWALGLLPPPVIVTLLFIIGIEIAKHTIFVSTYGLIKVWIILSKIKFW